VADKQDGAKPTQNSAERSPIARPLLYAFAGLLLISGAATFMGLYELMNAGRTGLSLESGLYSALVVAILTGIMGVSAEVAVGTLRYRFPIWVRISAMFSYAGLAILAVALAFAFWWSLIAAKNATENELVQEVARVETSLRDTRGLLSSAGTQLDLVAKLSSERSAEENARGGTCIGTGTGVGEGPITDLRAGHAATFGNIRSYASTRLTQLDKDMTASALLIGTLRQQAGSGGAAARVDNLTKLNGALASLADQTKSLAKDPALASYRQEMRTTAAAYRGSTTHLGGLVCVDPGMASAIEGAEQSIGAIRPAAAPSFGIYEGNEATMEAMKRFFHTLFSLVSNASAGLREVDEMIAFAIGWVVELAILVIVALRGRIDETSAHDRKVENVRKKIAANRVRRSANHMRATETAMARNEAWDLLGACPALPFDKLLLDWKGKRYLVIPQTMPASEIKLRDQAKRMLDAAGTLDGERGSGVWEQLRLSGKRLLGFIDHDRRAQTLLVNGGAEPWSKGSSFRWFLVNDAGLQSLASWALVSRENHAGEPSAAMAEAIKQYQRREAEAVASMAAEKYLHRAEIAEAKRRAAQEQHRRAIAALRSDPWGYQN